eukprot:668344-Hanusia_phi.AAC.4
MSLCPGWWAGAQDPGRSDAMDAGTRYRDARRRQARSQREFRLSSRPSKECMTSQLYVGICLAWE